MEALIIGISKSTHHLISAFLFVILFVHTAGAAAPANEGIEKLARKNHINNYSITVSDNGDITTKEKNREISVNHIFEAGSLSKPVMLYIMMPWVVIAAVVYLLGFLIGFFTKYRFFSKWALFYISILIGYVCEILLLIFILPRLIIPAVVIGAAGGIILWLSRNGRRMYFTRVCLKTHFRNLHAPLCGIFAPDSVDVAHYDAFIWDKSPTKCDAHLVKSSFQTHPSFLAFTAIMISGLMFVLISYPIGAEIPHKAPNAAFSLKTTSRDMTRFGEKLLDLYNNEDVFVTEMFSPQVELDRDNSWGLGLAIERVGEEQYYWHSGINPGMHSLIVMDPDSAKVLVIMTNSDYGFEFAREVSSNEFGMFGDWEIPRDTLKN